MPNIQLLVGLGNPGPEYADTRHNAGAWFLRALTDRNHVELKPEKKFLGLFASDSINGNKLYYLIPTTFMNLSGQAIKAVTSFYKIAPESILVAYDDIDLPSGAVRLKQGGGHGGHNGLRDTINHLSSTNFYRLRFGVDHPGHRDLVHDYVLHRPSKSDKQKIDTAIDLALCHIDGLLAGDIQKTMKQLHTET